MKTTLELKSIKISLMAILCGSLVLFSCQKEVNISPQTVKEQVSDFSVFENNLALLRLIEEEKLRPYPTEEQISTAALSNGRSEESVFSLYLQPVPYSIPANQQKAVVVNLADLAQKTIPQTNNKLYKVAATFLTGTVDMHVLVYEVYPNAKPVLIGKTNIVKKSNEQVSEMTVEFALEQLSRNPANRKLAIAFINKGSKSANFRYSIRQYQRDLIFNKTIVKDGQYAQVSQSTSIYSAIRAQGCSGSAYVQSYLISFPEKTTDWGSKRFNVLVALGVVNSKGEAIKDKDGNPISGRIDRLASFAKRDIGTCNSSNVSANRTGAKQLIRDWLWEGKPIIGIIRTGGAGKIVTGGLGHFVTIVGLTETALGTGSVVRFIDPLDKSANIKIYECDYTTFLNSMQAASAYAKYNLLPIACEQ